MKRIFIFLFLLYSINSFGQHKNYYYITWGYNNSAYTKSDIHFSGNNYDFTLFKVIAKDRQTPLSKETLFNTYLNIEAITIPQFNCRFGKRISEKWAVSVGWDHMKYVMQPNQDVKISGSIGAIVAEQNIPTQKYAGQYDKATMKLSPDFLTFEHTDGYNVATVELDRYLSLYHTDNQRFTISGTIGAGIGAVIPRSDVRLFGIGANHNWNLSGEGATLKTGLQMHFAKILFLETCVKTGYTYLHAIPTTGSKTDRAQQGIAFLEGIVSIGFKKNLLTK